MILFSKGLSFFKAKIGLELMRSENLKSFKGLIDFYLQPMSVWWVLFVSVFVSLIAGFVLSFAVSMIGLSFGYKSDHLVLALLLAPFVPVTSFFFAQNLMCQKIIKKCVNSFEKRTHVHLSKMEQFLLKKSGLSIHVNDFVPLTSQEIESLHKKITEKVSMSNNREVYEILSHWKDLVSRPFYLIRHRDQRMYELAIELFEKERHEKLKAKELEREQMEEERLSLEKSQNFADQDRIKQKLASHLSPPPPADIHVDADQDLYGDWEIDPVTFDRSPPDLMKDG